MVIIQSIWKNVNYDEQLNLTTQQNPNSIGIQAPWLIKVVNERWVH